MMMVEWEALVQLTWNDTKAIHHLSFQVMHFVNLLVNKLVHEFIRVVEIG